MLTHLKESNPLFLLIGIVLIPVAVAVTSLWVDTRIAERQEAQSKAQFERQERLVLAQTMDAYFEGVGTIMSGDMESNARARIIVARTSALLKRLNRPEDRANVIRFISQIRPQLFQRPESGLARSSRPFIDLAGLDLSGADLSFVSLFRADLGGADLSGANLQWANLRGARLTGTNLSRARLSGALMTAIEATGARFDAAVAAGTDFTQADLRRAQLQDMDASELEFDGIVTQTDFSGAQLGGATWLDGKTCAADSVGECR